MLNPMQRQFGDRKNFVGLPQTRVGFTFLMDANNSKYFYNYFMGVKQTNKLLKNEKKSLKLGD